MAEQLFNVGRDPGLKLGFFLDQRLCRGVLWVVLGVILLLEFLFLNLGKGVVVSC